MTKSVEVHLGYFKQGDDLGYILNEKKDPVESLKAHAEQMRSVAEHLDQLAEAVSGHEIKIYADTHMIRIECEDELAEKLVTSELADEDPFEDEYENEDEEEEVDD